MGEKQKESEKECLALSEGQSERCTPGNEEPPADSPKVKKRKPKNPSGGKAPAPPPVTNSDADNNSGDDDNDSSGQDNSSKSGKNSKKDKGQVQATHSTTPQTVGTAQTP